MANEQVIESAVQSKELSASSDQSKNDGDSKEAKPAETRVWKYQQKQKLRETLTPLQFHITQEKGTERPNSGAYVNVFDAGHYSCVVCDNPVFSSDAKYKSYCGWATFHKPFSDENCVDTAVDTFDGLVRTEVKCSKCGSHLGHVFDDGPKKLGGDRYCVNSVALKFVPSQNAHTSVSKSSNTPTP